MHEDARRGIYITWGAAVVVSGLAFILGGPYWGWILVCMGTIISLRGHFPQWFTPEFWAADRISALWVPVAIVATALTIQLARLWVQPLPFLLRYPSLPDAPALASPYIHRGGQVASTSAPADSGKRTAHPQLTPETSKQDVGLKFVNPTDVSFEIWCLGDVTVKDFKYYFVLLALDLPRYPAPGGGMVLPILPIPASASAGDFIRPKGHLFQTALVSNFPAVKQMVKRRDRVFGYGSITCPDCITERFYWVFFLYGKGGWYLEFDKDKSPKMETFSLHTEDLLNALDLQHNGIPIK